MVTPVEILHYAASGITVGAAWRFTPTVAGWIKSFRASQAKADATVLAAEVTGKHETAREHIKQDGETDRAEIGGVQAIVSAATAWGVAVAAQHRECEEARKRDARECDERITALENRLGMRREQRVDPRRERESKP